MRFLVLTTPREAVPPEVRLQMIDAMRGWVETQLASGRMVDVWAIAGTRGGGGILEVDSHEELNEVMAGFPFGQRSNIEVHALADINIALDQGRAATERMMKARQS